MGVDGFRFDLASALARSLHDVDELSVFLSVIQQDPTLSRVKLIAEPWDVGEGGYQVGEFPPLWTEWNDKFRDTVRDFWRGAATGVNDLAYRLSGSSDLYAENGRRPYASINFVTAHDGFTLRDLVSYNRKHNEVNGEDNRDGSDDNRSWNCGVEGVTADPAVLALRNRQVRNFLTTLVLSVGVPMLLAGDEMGRTQGGNNNAYCQDNEISWVDWSLAPEQERLQEFARNLLDLRRRHPVFRQRLFFEGRPVRPGGRKDVGWFGPDGAELAHRHWLDPALRTLGMFLGGDAVRHRGQRGERIMDDSFLLILHAGHESTEFRLPGPPWGETYELVVDTAVDNPPPDRPAAYYEADKAIRLAGRSAVLLRALP
jgi:isoamylase